MCNATNEFVPPRIVEADVAPTSAWKPRHRGGVLIPPGEEAHRPIIIESALASGAPPAFSWLARARVGDDQGREGACMVFALSNSIETQLNIAIPSARALHIYRDALKHAGRPSGGLYPHEGVAAVIRAGLVGAGSRLRGVNSFADGRQKPIIAIYEIDNGWNRWNRAGCLDHLAGGRTGEFHAVVLAAGGKTPAQQGNDSYYCYVQNSWGYGWAWRGIGVIDYAYHIRTCHSMYQLDIR